MKTIALIIIALIATSFIIPKHRYMVHYKWIHHESDWGYKEDGGYLVDSAVTLRHKNDTIKIIIQDHD